MSTHQNPYNLASERSFLSKDNTIDDSHSKIITKSNNKMYSKKELINKSINWGSNKNLNQIIEEEMEIPRKEEIPSTTKRGNLKKTTFIELPNTDNIYINEESTKYNTNIRKDSSRVIRSINFDSSDNDSDASFLMSNPNPNQNQKSSKKLSILTQTIKRSSNKSIFLTSKTDNFGKVKSKKTQKTNNEFTTHLIDEGNLEEDLEEDEKERENRTTEKLVLPELKKIRNNKSHHDILNLMSKNLCQDLNNQNSFFLSDEKDQERKFSTNLMHDNSEINKGRFKKKVLPPTLEAPKHNNNRMIPSAQIFMKNFFSHCKYQSENVGSFIKEINKSCIPTARELKTKKELEKLSGIPNQDVEKKQFMEDKKDGKSIRSVKLLGPPVVGVNKYSFGDKNDVILIGDVINKMKNNFTNKCRHTIIERIDEGNPEALERKKMLIIAEETRKRRRKQDDNCKEIEESIYDVEKRKIQLMEDIRKKREREEREKL